MRGLKSLKSVLFLFSALILPGAIQCNAWAQRDPATPPAARSQMLPGAGSAAAGGNAIGRLPAGQRLNLAFTLRLRNQEELRTLLQDIYNPASAHYRQYLSVEEFTERFGPTAGDHERVLDFARSSGLTVTHTSANRLVVDVNGAVEDIERTFGVRMHVYRHPVEQRTFYAPDVEPSIDPGLPIQGVAGLSTLNLPHPASPQAIHPAISQAPIGGSGLNGSFTASDLRAACIPGVTLTGAGQSVGLFEMNGYNLSDIQAYFSSMGESLSVPILNVLVDGVSAACGVSCDDSEEALDIEMAMALAPDLSAVIVYEGDTPVDILNQMAADNLAKQLSCSYVFVHDPANDEPIFLEYAAQGQSFFASSGDGGAYSPPDCVGLDCWTSRFPADDPYVTAVGGTLLFTDGAGGAWLSETTWPSSGGGLNSDGYLIPSYQAPLINALNQGSSTLRNIPDVAAVASNIYAQANGEAGSSGGTSASAPLWASFTALVNQQANGAPVGFLNPLVYPLALTAGYDNDFHDIITGNNFNSYSPDLFSAVTGYDLATGLGSPNGQNLINALAPVITGANFTLLSSSPTLIVAQGAQGTVQITLQAVNGFNGTVNLGYVLVGQPTGLTASLSQSSLSGAAASTLTVSASTATSSPSAMVAITGTSGGLTQSIYVPVTVLLPNLVETLVSNPPASVMPGATFTVVDFVENRGQAGAGSSVTGYYLSGTASKNALAFPLGTRTVPALAANAISFAPVTVTVPGGIWPNTPYHLLACADDTNSVAEATSSNCLASSTTTIFSPSTSATTTSLTLTSSGAPASSVAPGAVVTLTASVVAGSTPVKPGQVNFCDATAAHCTDVHLLGTAQLTPSGTATLRFVPGIGNHSYNAIFAGTTGYAASTSGNASLQVTGTHPTTTTVGESGSAGDYLLSATVTGVGGLVSPGGSMSFLDTSNSNASLGGATLAAGTSSLGWLASQTPATGADPSGVAAADFNGDGIPDLAIANRNDDTVTILLGNGDGTFRPAAVIPYIFSAQAIAAGDFNGDGFQDLAVTNSGYDAVTILLGNGDGTFTEVSTLSTGILPAALAIADLNGDGIPDLAVANYADTVLSVFLGNGDGTFTTAPVVQLSGSSQGVAVGDFNRDGRMDLAVAVANPSNEIIEVLLGNGDGTFTPSGSTLSVGSYPSAIVSADFDGDGIPDLAVTIAEGNNLAVFLGNGDGTFRPAAASPETGSYPLSLVAADFNGDGIPDFVVGNDGSSTLTILLGNGDGTFTAASSNVATGNSPISIAAADFNGDGFPDLASANQLDNTSSVFLTQLTWTATASVNGVSPSGTGSHLVDASYGGDTNYGASVSATFSLLTGATVSLPAPPSFPAELVGITSPPQSVMVTNTGGANLTFTAIGVTGPFAISPTGTTCSTSSPVPAAGNCTVAVTFTPTAGGAASGSLSLTDNGPGSPQTLDFTGTGLNPVPGITNVSPISATVGAAAQTLTINGMNFVSTSTVTYNGASYAATFVSSAQLTITLSTNDQAAARNYAVVVTNPAPGGGASSAVSFTVNNPIPGITSVSPISATAGAAAQTLTINGTNFVSTSTVTYNGTPHAATFVSSAQLTINLSASDQAATGNYAVVVTNPVPGGGPSTAANFTILGPAVSLSAPPTFPSQSVGATSSAQIVTLTNTGTANLSFTAIAVIGPFAISASGTTCSTSSPVAGPGTCTVAITFTPTAEGAASGVLSFTDNAPGNPQTVRLGATGLGPVVSLSPPSLTFANQLSGTTSTAQPVTLANTGNAVLSITSIAASGDFAETNACGTSLAAGSNCTINVTFTPTAGTARGGILSITENAPAGVQTLTLAGTGEDFSLTLPSGSSSTSTVSPGQTATYPLSLGGLGGLTQAINFTCTGAPSEAICMVNPASAIPGVSGTVSLTVTFSTMAPNAAVGRLRGLPLGPVMAITLLLLSLVAMAGLSAIMSRPQLHRRRWALAWCGIALFALAAASCGGGGGSGAGGVSTNPGTPAGTYSLVVTGAASSAVNLTHSMTLTLTVN